MKIGVLGTGTVGETLGSKFVALGHDAKMGSRSAGNAKAAAWAAKAGARASQGTFADAAAFGEVLFNCTHGTASVEVLQMVGAQHLKGKLLIDVSNPLDMVPGKGPQLAFGLEDSLGERLQAAFPELRVVKTLNIVNCSVMVDPSRAPAELTMFMAGNDAEAKRQTREILEQWLGWRDVLDLGDITGARATEAMMPIWLKLWGSLKTPDFGFKVVR